MGSNQIIDPILTTPGGWGLRNPVPKGPGQRSEYTIATQHGRGLAEIGRHYDLPDMRVNGGAPVPASLGRAHSGLQRRAGGGIMVVRVTGRRR